MVFPDPTEHGDRTVAGPLEGMTIVFTGALESMTREAARALVEQAGGSSPGSVSRSTQILVAGPGAGSKRAKAESLGVQVMDEMAFLRWLQERGISAPTS
jgi:DNA ligase (NAD+)